MKLHPRPSKPGFRGASENVFIKSDFDYDDEIPGELQTGHPEQKKERPN